MGYILDLVEPYLKTPKERTKAKAAASDSDSDLSSILGDRAGNRGPNPISFKSHHIAGLKSQPPNPMHDQSTSTFVQEPPKASKPQPQPRPRSHPTKPPPPRATTSHIPIHSPSPTTFQSQYLSSSSRSFFDTQSMYVPCEPLSLNLSTYLSNLSHHHHSSLLYRPTSQPMYAAPCNIGLQLSRASSNTPSLPPLSHTTTRASTPASSFASSRTSSSQPLPITRASSSRSLQAPLYASSSQLLFTPGSSSSQSSYTSLNAQLHDPSHAPSRIPSRVSGSQVNLSYHLFQYLTSFDTSSVGATS